MKLLPGRALYSFWIVAGIGILSAVPGVLIKSPRTGDKADGEKVKSSKIISFLNRKEKFKVDGLKSSHVFLLFALDCCFSCTLEQKLRMEVGFSLMQRKSTIFQMPKLLTWFLVSVDNVDIYKC